MSNELDQALGFPPDFTPIVMTAHLFPALAPRDDNGRRRNADRCIAYRPQVVLFCAGCDVSRLTVAIRTSML